MNPLAILKARVTNHGFPVSQTDLVKTCAARIKKKWDIPFTYGRVLFTVSQDGIVHVYGLDSGEAFLPACRHFMSDVWKKGSWRKLRAPISSPRVMRLAERFGWKFTHRDPWGFSWYSIDRS